MENLKQKILKICINHSVSAIKNACKDIHDNIEEMCLYTQENKNLPSKGVEEVSVNIESVDPNLYSNYPINGTWVKKLEYVSRHINPKKPSYSTAEIRQFFYLLEKTKNKKVTAAVDSVLNYCTQKYPQPFIEEISGNKRIKRFSFKIV